MKAFAGAAAAVGLCCALHVGVFAAVTGLALWSWAGPVAAVVAAFSVLLVARSRRRTHDGDGKGAVDRQTGQRPTKTSAKGAGAR